jgi:tol-pal system protein YbgF
MSLLMHLTNRNLFTRLLLVIAATSALMITPTSAGIFDDDEARKAILDLRTKVDAMRKSQEDRSKLQDDKTKAQDEDNAQLRRSIIDLNNQNEQLKAEIARLRGVSEQQGNAITGLTNDVVALQRQQKAQVQTIEDRVRLLEPQQVIVDGRQVMMDQAEKRGFDAAFATFKANDFSRAVAGFNEFNTRYPRSAYAPQAYYYLGNSHYALKDCRAASDAFSQLASRYPEDGRAAESLLSVANCQVEMGDKKSARRAYEQVIKQYPGTEEAATAKDRLARVK